MSLVLLFRPLGVAGPPPPPPPPPPPSVFTGAGSLPSYIQIEKLPEKRKHRFTFSTENQDRADIEAILRTLNRKE